LGGGSCDDGKTTDIAAAPLWCRNPAPLPASKQEADASEQIEASGIFALIVQKPAGVAERAFIFGADVRGDELRDLVAKA
jgi:hypothetical protein